MNRALLQAVVLLSLVAGLSACASQRTVASREAVAAYNRCVVATKQADLEVYRRCHSAQWLARMELQRRLDAEEALAVAKPAASAPVELEGEVLATIAVGGAAPSAEPAEPEQPTALQDFEEPPPQLISRDAPEMESPVLDEDQAWMRGVAQSAPYETRIIEVVMSDDFQTVVLQTRNRSGLLDQQMEHDESVVMVQENGRWVIDKDCCEYSNARFASP